MRLALLRDPPTPTDGGSTAQWAGMAYLDALCDGDLDLDPDLDPDEEETAQRRDVESLPSCADALRVLGGATMLKGSTVAGRKIVQIETTAL
eukprot:gene50080-36327_t